MQVSSASWVFWLWAILPAISVSCAMYLWGLWEVVHIFAVLSIIFVSMDERWLWPDGLSGLGQLVLWTHTHAIPHLSCTGSQSRLCPTQHGCTVKPVWSDHLLKKQKRCLKVKTVFKLRQVFFTTGSTVKSNMHLNPPASVDHPPSSSFQRLLTSDRYFTLCIRIGSKLSLISPTWDSDCMLAVQNTLVGYFCNLSYASKFTNHV